MLDWDLLQRLLIISMACSSITVMFIQKTKKFCKNSRCVTIYGLIVNIIAGMFFTQTFTTMDYIKGLWIGLFSFIGADSIYKNLEGKLATYKQLNINKNINEENNDLVKEIKYE